MSLIRLSQVFLGCEVRDGLILGHPRIARPQGPPSMAISTDHPGTSQDGKAPGTPINGKVYLRTIQEHFRMARPQGPHQWQSISMDHPGTYQDGKAPGTPINGKVSTDSWGTSQDGKARRDPHQWLMFPG